MSDKENKDTVSYGSHFKDCQSYLTPKGHYQSFDKIISQLIHPCKSHDRDLNWADLVMT